jgi:hypothetical protein
MTSLNIATIVGTSAGLTTATTSYLEGEQLGTLISYTMATASGIIIGAVLTDKSNAPAAIDAFLYDRVGITLATDNTADTISDADSLFQLGVIQFPPGVTKGNNCVSTVDSLAIPYVANSTTVLGLQLVARSGRTFFGAVGDIQVRFLYSKDV